MASSNSLLLCILIAFCIVTLSIRDVLAFGCFGCSPMCSGQSPPNWCGGGCPVSCPGYGCQGCSPQCYGNSPPGWCGGGCPAVCPAYPCVGCAPQCAAASPPAWCGSGCPAACPASRPPIFDIGANARLCI